jgi:hypothetical protein
MARHGLQHAHTAHVQNLLAALDFQRTAAVAAVAAAVAVVHCNLWQRVRATPVAIRAALAFAVFVVALFFLQLLLPFGVIAVNAHVVADDAVVVSMSNGFHNARLHQTVAGKRRNLSLQRTESAIFQHFKKASRL